jgi:uncharacterized protein (DUF2236 family)
VTPLKLEFVRAAAVSRIAGIFGPESLTWQIDREAVIFLGAGRALLLQLAHPWIAAAIAQHSRVLADPIGRFHRTFGTTFTLVFGTVDQSLAAARRLHHRHAAVSGTLPVAVGPFAQGSIYRANNIPALRWVHATLTETALTMHDLMLPPLTREERDRYCGESRLFGALLGLPRASLPADWDTFAAYVEAMQASDVLTVGETAREIARQIFSRAGSWLRMPNWYGALTTKFLPPRIRDGFGLSYGDEERRAAERAITWIRHTYPLLPAQLRYVGPYHEAKARLSGRPRPNLATQVLNRMWIGRRLLDPTRCPRAAQR